MKSVVGVEVFVERLDEILERVRQGDRFVIERDDAPIAEIVPPVRSQGVTGAELAEALCGVPRPDEAFADDLDEIHSAQGRVPALR